MACWYSTFTNSVRVLKYSSPNSSFKTAFHDGSIFTSTSSRDSCHREVVWEFMRTLYQASSSSSFCAGLERPETIVHSCHSYDFVNWLIPTLQGVYPAGRNTLPAHLPAPRLRQAGKRECFPPISDSSARKCKRVLLHFARPTSPVNKWLLKLGLDSENYSRYAP